MVELETAIAPEAWRVEFAEGATAPPDGVRAIEIAEPRNVRALLTPVAVSDALAEGVPQPAALTLVWMPTGVNTPPTIERDVDEWMRAGAVQTKEANVRADVRTLRVVWGGSRAVLYANQGDLHFALDAILRFTLAQREVTALEAAVKSTWIALEADTASIQALPPHDRKRREHVRQMTEITTRMRIAWLRISRSIEQLESGLAEPSKRVYAELSAAVSLFEQVENLEDSIEFAFEQYELANTRLIDLKLVRQERLDSVIGYGIVYVLLIVQIWLMLHGM